MGEDYKTLQDWLERYDVSELHNEDDVETKFVLPLFRMLGYHESHRRGKYPVELYAGRKGRKHEVDQVYFAEADAHRQTAGAALVIVEAKRADEINLEEAIAQAQSYGERLRPLLLVITNGLRLIVYRRRRFDSDEEVFDLLHQDFATADGAQRLTELLRFDVVLAQHQQLNDLSHERYIRLEQALRAYPDIQGILAQGDFPEAEAWEGAALRIRRPKAQIEGELPMCLGGGSCEITFSHILRRGLRIQLDHAAILSMLMVGIGSAPAWDTRHFIERETEETYLVRLANTETRLSDQEAQDLCSCIDRFAGAYRAAMMQAEDILESWTFPIASCEGDPAFYLTSVHVPFWKQVRQFADDHDWRREGRNPEWSRFEFWMPGFRLGHERGDHAWIGAIGTLGFGSPVGFELKHLVYVLPDGRPLPSLDTQEIDWQQNIGPNGQWSVQYTDNWLTEQLLPEVAQRCRTQGEQPLGRCVRSPIRHPLNKHAYPPQGTLDNTRQLVAYIEDIQRWLTRYSARTLQAAVVRAPFRMLLDLGRNADHSHLDLHYVTSNMASITPDSHTAAQIGDPNVRLNDYFRRGEMIADDLDQVPTVSPRLLDRAMRSFSALLDDAEMNVPQSSLNNAWKMLKPLWKLAQFEQRHVWPLLER
ncbi:type I restriction enzyme HsdR N-terminal domain-containing protein [Candidatus Chloroploca sp. M-50]|uniref:Type I restriction enzyme HsdR N-terminal domain-containing protein n=1 Tax=Candidatus Chloroploca mongolica TaxID=2528176 RepID=A0ABS4D9X8_9CHLR|nr:type I restriction enzyme HsdR N-terminal domain-containing protein [Candidatus Chloroploca mongolica]MBP1466253.1 type I restriction enzyme HsdR N-terminal domain-containing protein [Candidatus Chloroploca mongolica]